MRDHEKPGEQLPGLFPGETIRTGASYPAISYLRHGDIEKPFAAFLPGGGHLARVAYGHPEGDPEDFLDYWLASKGWSLLALSYPSSHPAFASVYPRMTVTDWGESSAAIIYDVLMKLRRPLRITLIGWSMAGRVVNAFNSAAARLGLEVECFASLSATPPLPHFSPVNPSGEPIRADGLWDTEVSRADIWWAGLAKQNQMIGREIIGPDAYRRFYRVDGPIGLRGESDQGAGLPGLEAILLDMRTFDYSKYPLTVVVSPTGRADAWHALTDHTNWAFLNAQMLFSKEIAGSNSPLDRLREADWDKLRTLMFGLPRRLLRFSPGGHFFFLGKTAARDVTQHIVDLHCEARSVREELASILKKNPK
jgi:hypothetical protein